LIFEIIQIRKGKLTKMMEKVINDKKWGYNYVLVATTKIAVEKKMTLE
jgi:hypothetical protein